MSRKSKKKATKLVAIPEGLQIENGDKFFREVCVALAESIESGLLSRTVVSNRREQRVYFREINSPTVHGREGDLPALSIFRDERQSAWLVVELQSEYERPLILKHISLKLWQGVTTEAAHLCFRAEWDVRNSLSSHAQPHWNIHAPANTFISEASEASFDSFVRQHGERGTSFSDFLRLDQTDGAPVAPVPTPSYGLSAEHMHKFHFAMAANWHMPDGKPGPAISTTDEVVTWISSCARYIKGQFGFVMGTGP